MDVNEIKRHSYILMFSFCFCFNLSLFSWRWKILNLMIQPLGSIWGMRSDISYLSRTLLRGVIVWFNWSSVHYYISLQYYHIIYISFLALCALVILNFSDPRNWLFKLLLFKTSLFFKACYEFYPKQFVKPNRLTSIKINTSEDRQFLSKNPKG